MKDPKKVAAGRLGGRASGGNFKRNRSGASLAGRKSAHARAGKSLLSKFPLDYEYSTGPEWSLKIGKLNVIEALIKQYNKIKKGGNKK